MLFSISGMLATKIRKVNFPDFIRHRYLQILELVVCNFLPSTTLSCLAQSIMRPLNMTESATRNTRGQCSRIFGFRLKVLVSLSQSPCLTSDFNISDNWMDLVIIQLTTTTLCHVFRQNCIVISHKFLKGGFDFSHSTRSSELFDVGIFLPLGTELRCRNEHERSHEFKLTGFWY
jgi:hypothetical protein